MGHVHSRSCRHVPDHPFHGAFNPAWGLNLGYEDTKMIEAKEFLCPFRDGVQREPSMEAARQVALVQQVMMQSWKTMTWESIGEKR